MISTLTTIQEKIIICLVQILVWISLFILCIQKFSLPYLTDNEGVKVKIRIVGIFHSSLALSMPVYYFYQMVYKDHPGGSLLEHLIHLTCVSYFTAHTIVLIYYKALNRHILMHHIMTILAAIGTAYSGYIHLVNCWYFFYHLSHIPLTLRAILKYFSRVYRKLFEFMEGYSVAAFFLERVILGSAMTIFVLIKYPSLPIGIKAIGIAIWMHSLYTCYNMTMKCAQKIKRYLQGEFESELINYVLESPLLKKLKSRK